MKKEKSQTMHKFGTKPSDKELIRSTADIRVYYIWVQNTAISLAESTFQLL